MRCWLVQLKYGALGRLDKNSGPSGTDLLAYLYGPTNTSPQSVRTWPCRAPLQALCCSVHATAAVGLQVGLDGVRAAAQTITGTLHREQLEGRVPRPFAMIKHLDNVAQQPVFPPVLLP